MKSGRHAVTVVACVSWKSECRSLDVDWAAGRRAAQVERNPVGGDWNGQAAKLTPAAAEAAEAAVSGERWLLVLGTIESSRSAARHSHDRK